MSVRTYSNSESSAPIPIPGAKPSVESWFAAQIECYKEPVATIFDAMVPHVNEPYVNLAWPKVLTSLQNKDSLLAKALLNLYETIRTKCIMKEEVAIVRDSEKTVLSALEEVTNSLFDYDLYLKNPPKTGKNIMKRIDFLHDMAKNLVFLFDKRYLLREFMKRTFGTNNNTNNVLNRRSFSNLSNSSRSQLSYRTTKDEEPNILLVGGKRTRRHSSQRSRKQQKKKLRNTRRSQS